MHLFMHLPIYCCFFAEKQPLIYAQKEKTLKTFVGQQGQLVSVPDTRPVFQVHAFKSTSEFFCSWLEVPHQRLRHTGCIFCSLLTPVLSLAKFQHSFSSIAFIVAYFPLTKGYYIQ